VHAEHRQQHSHGGEQDHRHAGDDNRHRNIPDRHSGSNFTTSHTAGR
jgi:hypothetical protein